MLAMLSACFGQISILCKAMTLIGRYATDLQGSTDPRETANTNNTNKTKETLILHMEKSSNQGHSSTHLDILVQFPHLRNIPHAKYRGLQFHHTAYVDTQMRCRERGKGHYRMGLGIFQGFNVRLS